MPKTEQHTPQTDRQPIGVTLNRAEHGHQVLINKLDLEPEIIGDPERQRDFIGELLRFFEVLKPVVEQLQTTDQYQRLAGIADAWQTLLATQFRFPLDVWETIGLELPSENLKPSRRLVKPKEIIRRLESAAAEIALSRKLTPISSEIEYLTFLQRNPNVLHDQRRSSDEEMQQDWYGARLVFAADVLSGNIRLADQLPNEAFAELSGCWLEDVKRVMAYFRWRDASHQLAVRRGDCVSLKSDRQFYFEVCDDLHSYLVDETRKAPVDSFEQIADWIECKYLSKNGCVSVQKKTAREIIAQKAFRIWQVTGNDDNEANWQAAETYVRQFYENIIPAMTTSKAIPLDAVLQLFGQSCSSGPSCELVDAFEAAIALEFLPAEMISEKLPPTVRYL